MKKLIIVIIAACFSSLVFGQEIPETIVSTKVFSQEFNMIKNKTFTDNIVGKKIEIENSITKNSSLLLTEGNYYICQIRFSTDKGFGMIVYFDKLVLPSGSSIIAYGDNRKQKVGPFYENNNINTNTFALPLIKSNTILVEAKIPISKYTDFDMTISEIGCIPLSSKGTHDFGDTESCYVNVNCADAEDWQDQKRAVVKYTYPSGNDIGICTGSLINNTALDKRNFFLSAQHCAQEASNEELGQAIFYFNYESPDCENPADDDDLDDETVIGCVRIAASGPIGPLPPNGSDFHLFEINPIPGSYNVYYAGWNRHDVDALSGPGSIIQHPLADIKKISFVSGFQQSIITLSDLEAVITYSPSGSGGAVEGNSSGSGIFDVNKLIVGTVSYGSTGCYDGSFSSGDGGKFFYHWDKNGTEANRQLAPWLDPLNTGVMTLEGKNSGGVGIAQLEHSQSEIIIYPNPANDNIYLECLTSEKINKVKVLLNNINGTLVFEDDIYLNEKNVLNKIDISNLKPGMYFITISNLDNQFYKSSKFIKL